MLNSKLVVLLLFFFVGGCLAQTSTLNIVFMYPSENLPGHGVLTLRGSAAGLSWTQGVKMTLTQTNTWEYALTYDESDAGTVLQVKPLINDNVWSIGSNFQISLPGGGGSTSVTLYPWFYSTSGTYAVLPQQVYSSAFKNWRSLIIYTPPSYYENYLKTQTNILIMHDGENLFNASTSFSGVAWDCQDTIDTYVVGGEMDEVFILGIYNTLDRTYEYTYSYDANCSCPGGDGGGGDEYLDFIIDTVVPTVAADFRILTAQENLGILGSSLGGLISCYAGYTRPSVFSKAGCMSTSFWWNNQDFNNTIMPEYPAPMGQVEFYLDSGNAGPGKDDVQETITVRNHFESLGYQLNENLFYYLDQGGQHNEYYWGQRFHVPMTDLYPVPTYTPN